jgi:hypothetical protein
VKVGEQDPQWMLDGQLVMGDGADAAAVPQRGLHVLLAV